MSGSAPGAYFRAPVTIKTSTPADFVASLPGSPANQKTLNDIVSVIDRIKREREIARDPDLYTSELIMLEAYRSQVERIISEGRL